jgi:hypothetical protein
MPTARLSFKLPEEHYEFQTAMAAMDYRIVLQNALDFMRGKLKYEDHPLEVKAIIDSIRQAILDDAASRNLPLD